MPRLPALRAQPRRLAKKCDGRNLCAARTVREAEAAWQRKRYAVMYSGGSGVRKGAGAAGIQVQVQGAAHAKARRGAHHGKRLSQVCQQHVARTRADCRSAYASKPPFRRLKPGFRLKRARQP